LYERKVRIFDYPRFAEPFRDQLREHAERLAGEVGLEIEFIHNRNFREEERVKEVLKLSLAKIPSGSGMSPKRFSTGGRAGSRSKSNRLAAQNRTRL